ncbi:MAG: RluA family pseudouridine synthase [Candidatus Krumholzibacteria bacterium]|nr:RluA family pseudouridine synthase [Candidatus Krumholzibacteria bacterium]
MKRYTVSEEWTGTRADRFVRALFPGIPFPAIQMLLRKGKILLNGKRVPGNSRLEEGDILEIDIDEIGYSSSKPKTDSEEQMRLPSDMGLIGKGIDVIYEDAHVLVLNKPAGLVVQPGNRKDKGSLLDLLDEYRSRNETSPKAAPSFPYSPVHRLDRQTTGVLVIAKTRPAARALSRAFAEGLVEKVYLAVVEGVPSPDRATISTPLKVEKGKKSHSRPDLGGKNATSSYSVIKNLTHGRALLEIRIKTGRTHQIRAHLASIGHPVVGDSVYGAGNENTSQTLLLHAWKIRFPRLKDLKMIEVTAREGSVHPL